MLMQLQLPSKELLEQNKGKDIDKKKKGSGLNDLKRPIEREELKPFKRQSYHVAIAYHIFLKQIKAGSNPSPRDIDPTYNARRLRDQNQKSQWSFWYNKFKLIVLISLDNSLFSFIESNMFYQDYKNYIYHD